MSIHLRIAAPCNCIVEKARFIMERHYGPCGVTVERIRRERESLLDPVRFVDGIEIVESDAADARWHLDERFYIDAVIGHDVSIRFRDENSVGQVDAFDHQSNVHWTCNGCDRYDDGWFDGSDLTVVGCPVAAQRHRFEEHDAFLREAVQRLRRGES